MEANPQNECRAPRRSLFFSRPFRFFPWSLQDGSFCACRSACVSRVRAGGAPLLLLFPCQQPFLVFTGLLSLSCLSARYYHAAYLSRFTSRLSHCPGRVFSAQQAALHSSRREIALYTVFLVGPRPPLLSPGSMRTSFLGRVASKNLLDLSVLHLGAALNE